MERTIHGTTAPVRNVALFNELAERVIRRPGHLPGMAVFHGPSGFGKTFSATYAANKHLACYVEVGASWTRKKFCQEVLRQCGGDLHGRRTTCDIMDTIIGTLADEERLLIIDEADFVMDKGFMDYVREIYEKSGAPIILIGEETLPGKMRVADRCHNRIMDWVQAVAANGDDTRYLAGLYVPGLRIDDGLLARINKVSHGRIRRICVNLERVREAAALEGWKSVSLKEWADRPLFTGEPPKRRVL